MEHRTSERPLSARTGPSSNVAFDPIRDISRAFAVEQRFVLAQSAGGVTASEIYMRQSEPPCSRKSAVPGGIFGSLASSNGAQPIDRAEVWAVSGRARLYPLSLVCEPLVPEP